MLPVVVDRHREAKKEGVPTGPKSLADGQIHELQISDKCTLALARAPLEEVGTGTHGVTSEPVGLRHQAMRRRAEVSFDGALGVGVPVAKVCSSRSKTAS
jgi:hypothetical protein